MPLYSFSEFLRLYELGPEGREKEYLEDAYQNMIRFLPNMTMEEFESIIRSRKIPEKYNNIHKIIRNNFEYYMDLTNVDKQMERQFKNSKELIQKVDPSITIDIFSYYLDNEEMMKLCELAHSFDEMASEYKSKMSKYENYEVEAKTEENIKRALNEKYYIKLIEENIDLLTEDEKRVFEEYKKDPTKSYILPNRIRSLFGYGVKSIHAFDSFSEEADEILNNPEKQPWRVESIKKERIAYFKNCGIDVHKGAEDTNEEYNMLLRNRDAQMLWPKKERVKKFIEIDKDC